MLATASIGDRINPLTDQTSSRERFLPGLGKGNVGVHAKRKHLLFSEQAILQAPVA